MNKSKKRITFLGYLSYSTAQALAIEIHKHQEKPIIVPTEEKGINTTNIPYNSPKLEHLVEEIIEEQYTKYKSTSIPKSGRDERRERRKVQRKNSKNNYKQTKRKKR